MKRRAENNALVFVYGTLLQGMKRHSALFGATYEGIALIEAELHDLGDYPGLLTGRGSGVVGELYSVNSEFLQRLDLIEGYDPLNEVESLFVRQRVAARRFSDGVEVEVFSYFFNSYVDNRIHHGDYRRHLIEQSRQERWVVAYGSNLSLKQMVGRVGTVREIQRGYIDKFDLVFNKRSGATGDKKQAFANIAFRGKDGGCPAVAYNLTQDQIDVLDVYEGVPDQYRRISTLFTPEVGVSFIVEVYVAAPSMLVTDAQPTEVYFQSVKLGYSDHAFDHHYLMNAVDPSGGSARVRK